MDKFMYSLIVLFFLVVAFIIFRKFVLWYWRMNEIVDSLQIVIVELKKMNRGEAGGLDETQEKRLRDVMKGPG